MPRRKRCAVPGVPQLVSLRGNNQQRVFHGPVDYRDYLAFMMDASTDSRVSVHAFTLLPNRVLVLCTPVRKDGVSLFMQAVGRRYTLTFNARHERSGALWNGRFKASHVDPETHVQFAIRFVATFASHIGLAATSTDYGWTGHPESPPHVPSIVREICAGDVTHQEPVPHAARNEQMLSADMYEIFENALRHELAVGSEDFKERLAHEHGVRVHLGRPGRPRKQHETTARRFELPASAVGEGLCGAGA